MAVKIKLKIGTEERDVLYFFSDCFYPSPFDPVIIDRLSGRASNPRILLNHYNRSLPWAFKPKGQPVGGLIHLTMESTGNEDSFYEWMESLEIKNGVLEFYNADEEDIPCYRIEFWDAWVSELSENMSSTGSNPMVLQCTISAAALRYNKDVVFQKSWFVTDIEKKEVKQEVVEEEKEPKIVSIELLEGAEERTDAEVIQYVNIQQNKANHVDGTDVTHVDRLGQKLRLKVKFDKPGAFDFTVKLAFDNNVVYNNTPSSPESGGNYKYSESVDFTTDSNGEKTIDADKIFVSPAGGNVFTIKAVDKNNNEVTAKSKVKTKRLLYYVELNQKNLENNIHIGVKFNNEFESHTILFKEIQSGGVEIDFTGANVDKAHESIFRNKAQSAFNLIAAAVNKKPYCLGIAYANRNVWGPVEDSFPSPSIDINTLPGKKITIPIPDRHYLWLNVDNTIDWFMDCVFKDDGGGEHNILKGDCTPKKSAPNVMNDNSVEIDLSKVNIPTGGSSTGTITLKLRRTNGVYAGDAGGVIPFVLTSRFNNVKTQDDITLAMIHETGHKMGMVSDGSILDRTSNQYTARGHLGSHCHSGIALRANFNDGVSNAGTDCVMFGVINGSSGFCTDCAKAVKKVDLKGGI